MLCFCVVLSVDFKQIDLRIGIELLRFLDELNGDSVQFVVLQRRFGCGLVRSSSALMVGGIGGAHRGRRRAHMDPGPHLPFRCRVLAMLVVTGDASGKDLIRVPRFTRNVAVDYSLPLQPDLTVETKI